MTQRERALRLLIEQFAQQIRAEAMEEAAKEVCCYCQWGTPLEPNGFSHNIQKTKRHPVENVYCKAAPIWELHREAQATWQPSEDAKSKIRQLRAGEEGG